MFAFEAFNDGAWGVDMNGDGRIDRADDLYHLNEEFLKKQREEQEYNHSFDDGADDGSDFDDYDYDDCDCDW